ncbi:MAG: Ig-like domain-containing protein [Nitrospirae bacterium]|nr:Ig-like domain-containing protein [Candidatus Manganitrophaceae bacterium]
MTDRGIKKIQNQKGLSILIAIFLILNISGCGSGGSSPPSSDPSPPAVVSISPLPETTNVPLNSPLRMTFSEEMNPATLTADTLVVQTGGNRIAGAIQVEGKTVTFTPATPWGASATYNVTLLTGAKDLEGTPLQTEVSWTFETVAPPDTTRPTVSETAPASGAVNVPLNSIVSVTFSKEINPATVTAETIVLQAEGQPLSATLQVDGKTARLTPSSALKPQTPYTATVTTGVQDLAGNALAANDAWTFQTGTAADPGPRVLSTQPADATTGFATGPIAATFDHPIDPTTVTAQTFFLQKSDDLSSVPGSMIYDRNTNSVYFIPRSPLALATHYQAVLAVGIRDAAGVPLASEQRWSFTTEKPSPLIATAPSILTFMATPGGPAPTPLQMTLAERFGSNIQWSLTSDLPWLNLTPTSGSDSATLTATATTTQLDAGLHRGTVTITGPGAQVIPRKIPVQYALAESTACLDRRRAPYIAFMTPSSSTVAWECAPAGKVEWGVAPNLTEQREVTAEKGNKHFVTLSNLTPDTTYAYRVSTNDEVLGTGTFRTATGPESNRFSFVVFADSGEEGASSQRTLAALMEKLPISFGILPGDIVYAGGYESEFDPHYFAPYKKLISHLPFFPVVGNHDIVADRGATFKENFFHPQGNLYYDFHWGDTHFIALDSNRSNDPVQQAWLDQTLAASRSRWKIVYFHHPAYNSGLYGNNPNVLHDFLPAFEKYQVDVVFSGHAHDYERTVPINRITYFVTGGGGATLSKAGKSSFTAYSDSRHHFLLAEMTADTLTVKAIDETGAVFDRVVIGK